MNLSLSRTDASFIGEHVKTIFKIWQGNDLPGLKLVYSDIYTRIYKIA
jgi:hypothetical protein